MLAAQAQGCGNVLLKIKQGDSSSIKADIIVSPASTIDSLVNLRARSKSRDFCRLNNLDTVSWILPMILLRTQGFNPLAAFRDVRDYGNVQDMVQDVSDNKCVAAIPSGTLTNFKLPNISDITRTVKVIGTTPELPVGGLMVSASVPGDMADQVAKLSRDNLDQLNGLIVADALLPTTNGDIADTRRAFQAVGVSFDLLAN